MSATSVPRLGRALGKTGAELMPFSNQVCHGISVTSA